MLICIMTMTMTKNKIQSRSFRFQIKEQRFIREKFHQKLIGNVVKNGLRLNKRGILGLNGIQVLLIVCMVVCWFDRVGIGAF